MLFPLCVRVQDVPGISAVLPQIALLEWCQDLLVVHHQGTDKNNPHYHLVGRFVGAKVASVIQRLRRVLAAGSETAKRGNGFCSIKTWDEDLDAISYLFHERGDVPLTVQFNVPDSLVEQARARNVEIKAQVALKKKKERIDNARLFQLCLADCREIQKGLIDVPHHFPKWRVFRSYYKLCQREKKNFPQKFQMPGIIKRIQAELCDEKPDALASLYYQFFKEDFPDEDAPYGFDGALDS